MKSIVIVDNEDDLRSTIKTILTRRGYTVYDDATGDIIERPEIEQSDLILLDINLDTKDGRDLCLKLKQRPETKQIPLILISALSELPKTYHICGADDYLKKPFSSVDLIQKVEHFLHAA
jgi:CheY-like chemotaxis protein